MYSLELLRYIFNMTIEQTVEIPASHKLTLEIPESVPAGKTRMIIQFPLYGEVYTANEKHNENIPLEAKGQINNEMFRNGLRRAYGAWKDNPWTNHMEDINAMRDEWEHRDPWNTDPSKRHID